MPPVRALRRRLIWAGVVLGLLLLVLAGLALRAVEEIAAAARGAGPSPRAGRSLQAALWSDRAAPSASRTIPSTRGHVSGTFSSPNQP